MKFSDLLVNAQKTFPNLKIKYKDQSLLMKVLGKLLFFNKDYMTAYTTTVGETVYYPSENFIKNQELSSIIILLHELVHIKDSQKYNKYVFGFLYMSPQILSLVSLLLFLISWKIALPLTILFALPLPSFFRMYFEKRAYMASLYAINKLSNKLSFKPLLATQQSIFLKQFKNSSYYFMWLFKNLDKEFDIAVDKIKQNQRPFEDPVFDIIDDLINNS